MLFFGRTQPLGRYPIGECLDKIASLGFDGVELCLENDDLHPDTLTQERARHLGERIEALGLMPFSVSYHRDYVYEDDIMAQTLRAIRLTPIMGSAVFVFGNARPRTGDAAEWRLLVERTRLLVAAAEDCGVVLAEEAEPGFIVDSTAKLLRLFDEVPSAHLAANLDLGHMFLCDPDPIAAIRQVGEKIAHGHVENMRDDVHDHQLPQDGDMDLRAYLGALRQAGFEGGLALDLYRHDYEAVAPEALGYLRGLLAGLNDTSSART